jgi:hypothetical protein
MGEGSFWVDFELAIGWILGPGVQDVHGLSGGHNGDLCIFADFGGNQ